MKIDLKKVFIFLVVLLILTTNNEVNAQYFGKNKVQYASRDFKVLKTPHFDIYYYMDNKEVIKNFGDMSEKWYARHRNALKHRLDDKNPLMIYNNHSEFSQTTLMSENIGQGTGGVTEGRQNRVFMPFFEFKSQTDHVLGHEMVHAFQYDMVKNTDSLNLYNIGNLPLWMVEGMAEYLSIGPKDSHTSMWMRDAVQSNDFPSLKDLSTSNRYFPYRYGQAFWAFVAGKYGDKIIKPLYINTAKFGYQVAVDSTLGYEEKVISRLWKKETTKYYSKFIADTIPIVGKKLLNPKDEGKMNITPVLSPDGKYITFYNEKSLFSIDLYMAEVATGKIIRKLSTATEGMDIDNYNYLQDIGTWSPDGKKYAYTVMSKGESMLIIVNTKNGKTIKKIRIKELPYFSNASWSPNGNTFLLTAIIDGKSDLYTYDISSKKITQLMDDEYGEIHGRWSPEGNKIVFVSDRGDDTDLKNLKYGSFRICTYDLESKNIEVLPIFPTANSFSPQYTQDQKKIFFVSNADGFRNLYDYDIETKKVSKRTKYFTGISGITEDAPSFSINGPNNTISYVLYRKQSYTLYIASENDFPCFETDGNSVDFSASYLPPFAPYKEKDIIASQLEQNEIKYPEGTFKEIKYDPRFRLTGVAQSGVGVGYNSQYGAGLAGGIGFLFQDILNEHQIYAVAQVNGEIYDIGVSITYLNQEGRIHWGVGLAHSPYVYGYEGYPQKEENGQISQSFYLHRTFHEELSTFAALPLSQTQRLELNASLNHFSYRIEEMTDYYNGTTGRWEDRDKLHKISDEEAAALGYEPFNLAAMRFAYVGDNSTFGLTSPIKGERFRFEVGQYVGDYQYSTIGADYRKYLYKKPYTLAFRAMYRGRFGSSDQIDKLYPMNLGYDYFVRGYNYNSLMSNYEYGQPGVMPNDLYGNQIAVANIELRMPLSGPGALAPIKSGLLFTDIAFFFDAGMAWEQGAPVNISWEHTDGAYSPVFSAGASVRINMFGAFILEPYCAIPFQRVNPKPYVGLFVSGGGW